MAKKYEIITSSNPKEIVKTVNKWMERGWKPLGGLCSYREYSVNWFHQVLIKE